jgi:hypothetical protein
MTLETFVVLLVMGVNGVQWRMLVLNLLLLLNFSHLNQVEG